MSDCGSPANVGSMEGLGHDDEEFDDVPPAPPRVADAPTVLWLNYGDIERDCTHRECYEAGDVTWCEDAVFDSDVKYVRADEGDSGLLAWVLAHPETCAEVLQDAAAGEGEARALLEQRRAALGA